MFQKEVVQLVTSEFAPGTMVHRVATEFVETMLEPMIERYSLYPAKGTTIERFRHNSDQMMLTHILNGLFPTFTLVYEAQKRGLPHLSRLREEDLKVYVLGYTLHDLDKILGDGHKFSTRTHVLTANAYHKAIDELELLNARAFFPTVANWISEIVWLAVNTQRSRDINLSHLSFLPAEEVMSEEFVEQFRPHTQQLVTRVESALRDLCTLSDLLAFFVKSPEEAVLSPTATRSSGGILSLIKEITSDGHNTSFSLCYHKLADVRGLLSNQVHNGMMRYLRGMAHSEQEQLIPLLFFPNGVVYLNPSSRAVPTIDMEKVVEVIQQELRETCQERIEGGQSISFDPKGRLTTPRYIHNFLNLRTFLQKFCEGVLSTSSAKVAADTLEKLRGMQERGAIPSTIEVDYLPSARITQLGRFLINYVDILHKNLHKRAPHLYEELEQRLVVRVGEPLWTAAQQIKSSGGVDYRFYWLAARYLETHPLSLYESENPGASLEGFFQSCIDELIERAGPELVASPNLQSPYLHDFAEYLHHHLTFDSATHESDERAVVLPDVATELERYKASKRIPKSQLSCTICNSAYTVAVQEEASVLFQPWVYKNRLMLYKGTNAGGICSICSLELMLRQLLLRDELEGSGGRVVGKDYEAMELKYFFLYPAFFFTRQTYLLITYLTEGLQNLKLNTVYHMLREKDGLSVADLLRLPLFNLTIDRETIAANEQDERAGREEQGSMYLFERYESKHYPGFLFLAKKTFSKKGKSGERKKATTASWVEAMWLGLVLPLVTGARVVVTEEYLPLFHSAADFMETVVLDAPHPSVRHLLPMASTRLRLDELYGHRATEGTQIGGALAALSRAIELHIATEATREGLNLERFSHVARELETDQLFVFSCLKEQLRRQKLDYITGQNAEHYHHIYRHYIHYYHQTAKGDVITAMATRHERVTACYLKFYLPFNERKTWPKSHAIVRPIDLAAKAILRDTLNLTDEEIQLEMAAALKAWLDIVAKKGATGRVIVHGKQRDTLVWEFVRIFYDEIFLGYAQGQRSVLNSRLNRLKHACEEAFVLSVYQKRLSDAETNTEQDDIHDSTENETR